MSALAWLAFGFSVVVVLLTSLIKREKWDVKTKHLIAMALSAIGGAIAVYIKYGGRFTGIDITTVATGIYAGSQALYGLILRGTTIDCILTALGGNKNNDHGYGDVTTSPVDDKPSVVVNVAAPVQPQAAEPGATS